MRGRTALAAMLVSAALTGCGQETSVAPAKIEITSEPPAAAPPRPAGKGKRTGRVRTGTRSAVPQVQPAAPAPAAPAPVAPAPQPRKPRRTGYRRFRRSHLRALRAHCASRPENDPRCDGDAVNERVALAAFEATR